jgi:hypothetical protein
MKDFFDMISGKIVAYSTGKAAPGDGAKREGYEGRSEVLS